MSLDLKRDHNSLLLQKAVHQGVTYFDTADLYDAGQNEATIGRALREYRQEVIIATKVGNEWNKDYTSWKWNPSKKYILEAVDNSLRRLQTDYIDIYQLHGGTVEDPIDEVIEAFEQLVSMGKIRYYGISSIRPNVIDAYLRKSQIVSNMMQYSLLDRRPENECLARLKAAEVGVMVRGSVAKGLLIDKEPTSYLAHTKEDVETCQKKMSALVGKDLNTQSVAIQYVLKHPAVTSCVVGIRTNNHLQSAVRSINNDPLPNDIMAQLESIFPPHQYKKHLINA